MEGFRGAYAKIDSFEVLCRLGLTYNDLHGIMGADEGTNHNFIDWKKMYTQQWLDKKYVRLFFPWAERMGIEFELSNPFACFVYEDFEVRMHQSDWQKFDEHF